MVIRTGFDPISALYHCWMKRFTDVSVPLVAGGKWLKCLSKSNACVKHCNKKLIPQIRSLILCSPQDHSPPWITGQPYGCKLKILFSVSPRLPYLLAITNWVLYFNFGQVMPTPSTKQSIQLLTHQLHISSQRIEGMSSPHASRHGTCSIAIAVSSC